MTDLLFATGNVHKLREVQEIVGNEFRILSLRDVNIDSDIPETSDTISGNAAQKARFVYEKTGMDCFADDTGLEVDALDGRPGVYSARYAGEGCNFDDNVTKILKELSGVENRNAHFRCVVCLILAGEEYFFEGRIEGAILKERKGQEGFGYDPVFVPIGYQQTFAEMPPYLKNGISHRGKAMFKMMKFLKKNGNNDHG
jgi:XTP/dITP diphosphohydrolase